MIIMGVHEGTGWTEESRLVIVDIMFVATDYSAATNRLSMCHLRVSSVVESTSPITGPVMVEFH